MPDFKTCPKCSNTTAYESEVCPFCGNSFENVSPGTAGSPRDTTLPVPAVPSQKAPPGDWKSAWYELNFLTRLVVVITFCCALLENPAVGVIGMALGFFAFGSWAVNIAKEHNRSINWAYFWGFCGLLTLGLYWVYVAKLSKDPASPPPVARSGKTLPGEWAVLGLSLVFAAIIAVSESTSKGIAENISSFVGVLVIMLIIVYLIYLVIGRLSAASAGWGGIAWVVAIAGVSLAIFFLAVLAVPVLGWSGLPEESSEPYTFTTFQDPALGYTIRYPDSWITKTESKEENTGITDRVFASPGGKRGAFVQVMDSTGTPFQEYTLDRWTTKSIVTLQTNKNYRQFTLQKSERTTLSGYPAQRIEHMHVNNEGKTEKWIDYLLLRGPVVYHVGIIALDNDDYPAWSGTAEEMLASFTFTS